MHSNAEDVLLVQTWCSWKPTQQLSSGPKWHLVGKLEGENQISNSKCITEWGEPLQRRKPSHLTKKTNIIGKGKKEHKRKQTVKQYLLLLVAGGRNTAFLDSHALKVEIPPHQHICSELNHGTIIISSTHLEKQMQALYYSYVVLCMEEWVEELLL